ncbi:MAG: methyltransferase [Hyphomonadaceae bacterium]|nr:methyltransferase [Hyphomonadaceae bacterium]MCA8885428.1 methyltransferase [Hyphomonadaceae bacterium]
MPEIRTHKAGPHSGLWRLARADENFGAPYWAQYWGGGLALARHVLDHRNIIAGRDVIDLGCGSGLVAIAAAKADARGVTAIDCDPYAIAAARLNAAANSVAVVSICEDILDGDPPAADLILAGDLFYDPELGERVTAFFDRCLSANIEILIGDPGRAPLPRTRLKLLAEYPGPDFGDSATVTRMNAVFSFGAA